MKFDSEVRLKYQVYNSIFLTLDFDAIQRTGNLIPIFYEYCVEGYKRNRTPVEIVEDFLDDHKEVIPEDDYLSVLFRFVQYIERQVVLVDALEDASVSSVVPSEELNSLHNTLSDINSNWDTSIVQNALDDFNMRIVLTAHPTQFYPGSVLGIITELSEAVRKNELVSIKLLLEQLGKTPFFKRTKPTPYDEARSLNWYLESVFYHAVPKIYTNIHNQLGETVQGLRVTDDMIQLGFWPGGDRDGNPYVDSETTYRVAQKLNYTVLKCYYDDIRKLKRRLTFRGVDVLIEFMEQKLSAYLFSLDYQSVYGGEGEDEHKSFELSNLLNPLSEIRELLISKYDGLFLEYVDEVLLKVNIFKSHLASLDIRQDSRIVSSLIQSYTATKGKNVEELFALNDPPREEIEYSDHVQNDLGDVFSTIGKVQKLYGEKACHRFIISNTRSAHSVAHIYALARYCHFGYENELPLDIIPLFETIDDLIQAPESMRELYSNPVYAEHLKSRDSHQTIMLGFSDGTKDGGYFSANWQIYKSKIALSAVAREYGIKLSFFDGRGGPPARGGGEVYQYYAAQGPDIESQAIQLTIQGQTVSYKFGNQEKAKYYLERLLGTGLKLQNSNERTSLSKPERDLMNQVSDSALNKYKTLREHPSFMPYLIECSPLKYFGGTNIASRPAKRGKGNDMTLDDLRAIPFVSSWNQLKQNVPGYYGFGSGLQEVIDEVGLEPIKQLYKSSLLFKSLVSNSMQALSKCRFDLTIYLENDDRWKEIYGMIKSEYELTVKWLLEISGMESLLADQRNNKDSIELREQITLPLTTIQQYALMKINANENDNDSQLEKLVTRTMYGIVNAARNSA